MNARSISALGAIAFVFLLAFLPSLAGMLNVPQGQAWTGILTRNGADVNGYLGIIEEIRQGHLRARNLFTAEPHPPFQIRPYYTALGLIGRALPGVSTETLMEWGRLISSGCLLLLIFKIASLLFEDGAERVFAFLVLSLGSGLGWLQLVADPPDLRIVETSTLLTLVSPPLYSVSLSLILSILLLLHAGFQSNHGSVRFSILLGIAALWLGFDRPFSLATLCFSILCTIAIRNRQWMKCFALALPFFIGMSIAVISQILVLRSIPVYAEWNRQHVLNSPEWLRLMSSLGLLLPFAIAGFREAFRKLPDLSSLIVFYIAGSLLFSHLPIQFQERFLEGLPICVAYFACVGVVQLLRAIQSIPVRFAFGALVLVVLALSGGVAISNDVAAILRQSPPQYMPQHALEAMRALARLSKPEEAVLSSESSGNFIAAYAARPVVLGHRIQTAHYENKRALVEQFFRLRGNDPKSLGLLKQSGAQWIFWGPEEAWLARGEFNPAEATYLKMRYHNELVQLYQLEEH